MENTTRKLDALYEHTFRNNSSSSGGIAAISSATSVGTTVATIATVASTPITSTATTTTQPPSLSKTNTTVRQLWIEWKVSGSKCTNFVPVKELNRTLGAKWRSVGKDRAFYSRRKTIINKVEKRVDQGKTVDDAIEESQAEISSGKVCEGLDSYTTHLRKKTPQILKILKTPKTPKTPKTLNTDKCSLQSCFLLTFIILSYIAFLLNYLPLSTYVFTISLYRRNASRF
ncbi:unnamed protein product [Mucor hiemalis]